MTDQTADHVFFKNHRYALWHDSSKKLPMLSEWGIHPNLHNTATIRGYEAEYELDNNQLYLTRLNVGEAEYDAQFPPIGDVYPVKELLYESNNEDFDIYEFVYRLKHPLLINGVMTLNCVGVDDRQDPKMKVSWGPQQDPFPPEILKVKLEYGSVVSVKDVTQDYEKVKLAVNLIEQDKNDKLSEMPINEWVSYRTDEIRDLYKQFFDVTDE